MHEGEVEEKEAESLNLTGTYQGWTTSNGMNRSTTGRLSLGLGPSLDLGPVVKYSHGGGLFDIAYLMGNRTGVRVHVCLKDYRAR